MRTLAILLGEMAALPLRARSTNRAADPVLRRFLPATALPHESFPGAVGPAALERLRAFSTCEVSDALLALDVPSGGYIPGVSS